MNEMSLRNTCFSSPYSSRFIGNPLMYIFVIYGAELKTTINIYWSISFLKLLSLLFNGGYIYIRILTYD